MPVLTVHVYFSLTCFPVKQREYPCQLVQNFWTQHFKIPPSAPHPTAVLLCWTSSSLSPIFPGNIFSVVANKKWALAEISVVYTELNFSLFLSLQLLRIRPALSTKQLSTAPVPSATHQNLHPLKALLWSWIINNCCVSHTSDVSHVGAQGQTRI